MKKLKKYTQVMNAIIEGDLEKLRQAFLLFEDEKFDFKHEFCRKRKMPSTAMQLAVEFGYTDIFAALVEYGASYNVCDRDGNPPIVWAAKAGRLDIVKYLVEKGVDKETKGEYGYTVLYYAVKAKQLDVIRYLLEQGARVKGNTSVVKEAVVSGNLDILKCLEEYGADLKGQPRQSFIPLNTAISYYKTKIVDYLLEYGVDVNQKGYKGDTALMIAAQEGELEIAQKLVKYGADVFMKNDKGERAMEIAFVNHHMDVGRWLYSVEQSPEIYQTNLEQRLLTLSEKELMNLPQNKPYLFKQIEKLDLFARIFELMPYEKQLKLYKVIGSHMSPHTRREVENIIRDERLRIH